MVKRFQLRTKCVDVEMARAYLCAAEGELEIAVEAYLGDETWVGEQGERRGRGRRRGFMW
ncbi:hypothetical protein BDD12DRAFT_836974 [Trichophaea hybrida]|nr:hypothetical protein BDD12DRAFT_836974 [Trichophaea hybrida]